MDHYLILKNRPKRGRTTVVEWVMEWVGRGGGGAKGKSHQSQGKCVKKKTESS